MKKESDGFLRIVVLGLCCLAIAVIAAGSGTIRFPDTPKLFAVHFRFQEKAVSLHEPVVIVFEVHNGLSKPITVTVGALIRQYFDFALTTPSGQILHKHNTPPPDMVTVGDGKVTIAPGEEYNEPLVMNQWFPFATQGAYTLTSKLTSDIETADGSFQAEAETAQLRVNPRDAARLTKLCGELEKQVETAPNAEAAQEPARTLSYVEDPIAVPYLANVLSTNTLTYDKAIAGLQRIGNDAAIEVLLSALNNNANDIGDQASRALSRMEDGISNPRLRETVKKAIERSSERARNEIIKRQIAYLDYRDPNLQQAAIQTLMQMDQNALEQAEPALQRLVNDPQQPANVVADAKAALQKLHPRSN
jgi:hypothetical protein